MPPLSPTAASAAAATIEPAINGCGAALVFLAPTLGGFLYGYDIGATSFVLRRLVAGGGSGGVGGNPGRRRSEDDVFLSPAYQRDDDQYSYEYPHDDDGHRDSSSIFSHAHHDIPWWDDLDDRPWRQGMLVGAVAAGALLGSHILLTRRGGDGSNPWHRQRQWSRRAELRAAAGLYLLGMLAAVTSGRSLRRAPPLAGWLALVLGRLLFGVGVGLVMHGAPTYLAEMSPVRLHGTAVAAKETVIVLGILLGCAVGHHRENADGAEDWTFLYGVNGLLAVPMLLLTFAIPRPKRRLLLHGRRQEARESVAFVYRGDITNEFERIAMEIDKNQELLSGSVQVVDDPNETGRIFDIKTQLGAAFVRPALRTALGLILCQQLSGQPSVLSYSAVLFRAAGWNGGAVVATAFAMVCASAFTVLTVDHVGRRRAILTCCTVMLVATVALVLVFWTWETGDGLGPNLTYIALVALFGYIGGYQLGFGPVTWLVVSEVFPQQVRGTAMAVCVELNYLLNFAVQCLCPVLYHTLGWGPTLALFAVVLLAALVFVWRHVPETRGLSLEAIESQLLRESLDGHAKTEQSPLFQGKPLSYSNG